MCVVFTGRKCKYASCVNAIETEFNVKGTLYHKATLTKVGLNNCWENVMLTKQNYTLVSL